MREITFGRDSPAESSHNDFVQAPLLLIIIRDNKGFQAEQKDLFQLLRPHLSLSRHPPPLFPPLLRAPALHSFPCITISLMDN